MKDPFPTGGISFYKNKKVCVTGASGLIGSYVVKLLKESGSYVRAVVNNRPANEFTDMADEKVGLDLMQPRYASAAVDGFEIVMGCAGITGGVGITKVDPVSYVGPATTLAANTIHACFERKVSRYCFLSSTTVYPPSEYHVQEGDENNGPPYQLYWGIGESKRFLEKLGRYYHEKTGLSVACVRPSGAYGRFDNFNESTSHVMPGLISRAFQFSPNKEFELWGDGTDVRDLIHAQDVARGALLATSIISDARPINIASGEGITTLALAQTVLNAVKSNSKIVLNPSKLTALKTRLVNVSLAKELLGFTPSISLNEGIIDTAKWYRSVHLNK